MMTRLAALLMSTVISAATVVVVADSAVGADAPAQNADETVLTVGIPQGFLEPTMSISQNVSLSRAEATLIKNIARSVGATGHVLRFPTIEMTAHTRDGEDLQRLTDGWRVPMATMLAPVQFIEEVGGAGLAEVLSRGDVAMGETSARLRGARVGDVVTLRDSKFRRREFVVGAIVADQFTNWGDLLMSVDVATARLGLPRIARVAITNISSPKKLTQALRKRGIVFNTHKWRLRTTWDRPNPDGTLGLAELKELVGEFAYKPNGGSAIRIDPDWAMRNMVWKKIYDDIPLQHNCHRKVAEAIQGALSEIARRGLSRHIDVANSNRYGGCLTTRFNRLSSTFATPSRHAFGIAFDINVSTNQQWATPSLNCDVVRIFRKWGFAWGGNFWPADGMHFEWVGEPRHELGYPSKFCPNNVAVPPTTIPEFTGDAPVTSTP